MAYTWKNARLRRPAPFSVSSELPTRVLSSIFTPATSAADAAVIARKRLAASIAFMARLLEAVFHAGRTDCRARAPRGMALHVHCHRIHRDVRRRGLDVHGERGRVAAEPLRP